VTLFFGLSSITHMRNLLGPDEQLRVDQRGILWQSWSSRPVPWDKIVDIKVSGLDIVIKLRNSERYHSSFVSRLIANGGRTLRKNNMHVWLSGTGRSRDEALSAIGSFRV